MADQRSVVELVFEGVDRTSAATEAALGNAEKFSRSVGNLTSPIAGFTQDALKLEAALLTGAAAMTAISIVAAGDFDSAFREISTLIDEPVESLQDFRQAILEYAATSSQSLPEITGAVYSAISAGVEYVDSLEAVRVAEQLAVAGKADLQQSLVVLVSSLNAYNVGMDEAESFSDALFQAVRDGQTTLDELGSVLARVTGTAATLEVPFETLLAAISTLTAAGTPTNQAVTQINAALNALLNPSQQARDTAAELGIEFDAVAVKSLGFEEVLRQVAEATGGNEEQLARLFGSTQALAAVFPLVGAQAQTFADNIANQGNNAGATAEAYERMAGAISLQNQRILNSFRLVLIAIGDPLLAEYGQIADAIAAIFQSIGLSVSEGELGGIVEVIRSIMADAAEALRVAAENLPEALRQVDFTALERSVRQVVDAITGLFENFDLASPEGLAQALRSLIGVFEVLSTFSASAISSFQFLFDQLANNQEQILAAGRAFASIAGSLGGYAIQINALLPLFNAFLTVLGSIAGVIVGNQAVSLVRGLTALKASLGLTAAALGAGGAVAAAFIFASIQVYRLVDAFGQLRSANDRARQAALENAIVERGLEERWQRISRQIGLTVESYEELESLREQGLVRFNEELGLWQRVTESAGEYAEEVVTSEEAQEAMRNALRRFADESGLAYNEATGAIGTMANAIDETGQVIDRASESNDLLIQTLEDGTVVYQAVGKAGERAYGDIAESIDDVIELSEDARLRLREIASEEFIATIEARTAIDIANVEAETARIQSAFDSINTTILSTGDVIGSIVENLVGATGPARQALERQLREENRRRDAALEQQNKLIQEQILLLRERIRRSQRGDPFITVDGAGLQPHLEAFMWEILRTIQTRVNEDGEAFLLGDPDV